MSNNEKLIDLKKTSLTRSTAVDFVNHCREISDEQLVNQLLMYINALQEATETREWDEIEPITHVVGKGLKHLCEEESALKFYYLGYYSRFQEEIIRDFSKQIVQNATQQLLQAKHIKEILEYLYEFGCSRQSEISKELKINRSNLSRKMEIIVEHELINKRSGPKCVFYELSASGYEYCRKKGIGKIPVGKVEHCKNIKVAIAKSDFRIVYSDTSETSAIARKTGFFDMYNENFGANKASIDKEKKRENYKKLSCRAFI
jgi:DNA-binding MarR family transcriptional regulator